MIETPHGGIAGMLAFAIIGTFVLALVFSPRAAARLSRLLSVLSRMFAVHGEAMTEAYKAYGKLWQKNFPAGAPYMDAHASQGVEVAPAETLAR